MSLLNEMLSSSDENRAVLNLLLKWLLLLLLSGRQYEPRNGLSVFFSCGFEEDKQVEIRARLNDRGGDNVFSRLGGGSTTCRDTFSGLDNDLVIPSFSSSFFSC